MFDVDVALKNAKKNGNDVFVGKPASSGSIKQLEELLQIQLPDSYKLFLSIYGTIGIHDNILEGIWDDNPLSNSGIYGSTLEMRGWIEGQYEIQPNLWAIKVHEDGAYCVNTDIKLPNNELAIVNYEPYLPKKTFSDVLASSFPEYLEKWFFHCYA